MVERIHGGRCGDARGGGCGGGRGDLPNEEAARQRALRDIENDDLRQQVLQRDIENGDLRQQVRDLQRRLARLEKRWWKSNPMRSIASERRSIDDPLFNDIFTSSDADEPSKNGNNNIFTMSAYDMPVYDEDIFYELPGSFPVYDMLVYDEDMFSMPVYNEPVYDEDILVPVYDKPVYDDDDLTDSVVAASSSRFAPTSKYFVAYFAKDPSGSPSISLPTTKRDVVVGFDEKFIIRNSFLDKEKMGSKVAGIDWNFSGYGGIVEGCYDDWSLGLLIAHKVLDIVNVPRFSHSMILEGGSIQFDGEGMCLTTEECLKYKEVVEGNGGGFVSGKRGRPKGSKNRKILRVSHNKKRKKRRSMKN
ncbi:hypothetical protein SASPL_148772 [Salvia splendens]|uniref:Uncharacterized protein n=1 Tax=Salvia splendens TaxID=180675 RepID=A0A8X8WAJ6_SALSN|nr:hypothetical protein SASPL_148772 [Salvia splendens]